MTSIEDEVFARKRPVAARLKKRGFVRQGEAWVLSLNFMGGDFTANISTRADKTTGEVIDNINGEPYEPLRQDFMQGPYVGRVRAEYRKLLESLAQSCWQDVPFDSDGANAIARAVRERYGETPSFPWKDGPHRATGVFRRRDNGKWYGVVLNIDRKKLGDATREGKVDVVNVKIDPQTRARLGPENGVYPAYHMNKTHWVSVSLDETADWETVLALIDDSRKLTAPKAKRKAGATRDAPKRIDGAKTRANAKGPAHPPDRKDKPD